VKTLERFLREPPQIPTVTVWELTELAEYLGKQELFTRQSPQRLKVLREHALIESAVASNRIEGVEIDRRRVGTVIFGKSHLQDRNEQEVRGYQAALSLIHEQHDTLSVSPETVLRLHALTRPGVWDSGRLKDQDGEIIEKHADGNVSVRFRPLSAAATPAAIAQLCADSARLARERQVPPLIVWAACNLDLLCIHPFRDGNGRVSRLLLLLHLYHLGFTAGRYVSLERLIEQSKDRYYETLRQSSQGWHEGRHTPWPYINYLLYTLKELYAEFERRVGQMKAPRGEKAGAVIDAVDRQTGPFRLADIEQACPGVGREWIQTLLTQMKSDGRIECSGRGPAARWRIAPGSEGSTPK
jgi:Fic family protein